MADTGYAMSFTNDGRVVFHRASYRDRVRGKFRFMLRAMEREVPSLSLEKGTKVSRCVHEPNDDVLGVQLAIEVRKGAARLIPEVVVTGVYVERVLGDRHTAFVKIIFHYADDESATDRLDVPLSVWGIV